MSGKLRGSSVRLDSSTDEDDICESNYKMRLRESLRNMQQSTPTENGIVTEHRKRGRGPSKRPCLNKNALMARENRLRKKAYLEKIENKLSFYQQENKNLVTVIRKQATDIKRLSSEVAYLKSVLNNNTSITVLLKTINDGLRKINAQKKNSLHSCHVFERSDESDAQHKSACCGNLKENVLNARNTNIFLPNIGNDLLTQHSTTENQSCKSYVNEKRTFPYKNSNIDEISSSFLDSDYANIISEPSTVDVKTSHENKDASNAITSTTSSISEDSYMENTKELDNILPIAQADLRNVEEKKDIDTIGIDLDQLSSFNIDIFEDLPKCDEMMNTMENLNEGSNFLMEEEISQTLDNTGICLHVNSDKVSLEFCSICHLNSKNLGLN